MAGIDGGKGGSGSGSRYVKLAVIALGLVVLLGLAAVFIFPFAASVLFYLGAFSPQTSVPKSCTLAAGFTCYDFYLDRQGFLYLDLGQDIGRDVTITGIGCGFGNPRDSKPFTPVALASGQHKPVAGIGSPNKISCCWGASACNGDSLEINYSLSDGSGKTMSGQLSGPLESGPQ